MRLSGHIFKNGHPERTPSGNEEEVEGSIIMKILFSIGLTSVLFFLPQLTGATTLSPVIIDAKLDPGETGAYEIRLYNETAEDIFLEAQVEKFVSQGEGGEAKILPPNISDKSVTWVKIPNNSLVLKPGETASVPLIIGVPKTVDVGGYYLALMWRSAPGPRAKQSDQALIASRVGTLILLQVNGQVNNSLAIAGFGLKAKNKFYESLPIDFFIRLRNTGNVHQRPQGSIIIKDFLGRTVEILPLNANSSAILPQTTRIFESIWGESGFKNILINQLANFNIGRFSAKALIDYGDNQNITSELVYFWIWPWQLLILTLIILIIISLLVFKIKKHKS